jgi:hypothetical protein
VFDTTLDTSTIFGTTNATATIFNTSNTTNRTTSQGTARTTSSVVYERVTGTAVDTEVGSAGADNARYWDGSQWTET